MPEPTPGKAHPLFNRRKPTQSPKIAPCHRDFPKPGWHSGNWLRSSLDENGWVRVLAHIAGRIQNDAPRSLDDRGSCISMLPLIQRVRL
jgi:hypothetical protein